MAHIVDGAEVLHGGVVGAELVAGLDLLIHDGAADRGVDGIVADGLLGRRHLQLGRAQVVSGVFGLLVQILAGNAEDDVILTDGAALLDAEFRHGAGGSCRDSLLALVSKVCGVEGADAVHLCHSGLCGGQAARVGNSMVTVQVIRLASPAGFAPETERMVPFSVSKVVSGMTCAA